jgi:8-oxo-dGTP diphosphatase / 2-hydroxy-dATP diphosphatase
MKKILTLCMVCNDEGVLLGMKKRGFGAGRWNGFGGKVEAGETIEAAALREMQEEVSLTPIEMVKAGILEFSFQSEPTVLEVHIFKVTAYAGEPTESEEMKPQWFSWDEVPFTQMWVDDEYWFPHLQSDELFTGTFLFDTPATSDHAGRIIEESLVVVESL